MTLKPNITKLWWRWVLIKAAFLLLMQLWGQQLSFHHKHPRRINKWRASALTANGQRCSSGKWAFGGHLHLSVHTADTQSVYEETIRKQSRAMLLISSHILILVLFESSLVLATVIELSSSCTQPSVYPLSETSSSPFNPVLSIRWARLLG